MDSYTIQSLQSRRLLAHWTQSRWESDGKQKRTFPCRETPRPPFKSRDSACNLNSDKRIQRNAVSPKTIHLRRTQSCFLFPGAILDCVVYCVQTNRTRKVDLFNSYIPLHLQEEHLNELFTLQLSNYQCLFLYKL
jgi:hypothetical protein